MADTYIAKGLGIPISRIATAGTCPQSLMSIFNTVGSGKIIKIYRVWMINDQLAGTSTQGLISFTRISARTLPLVCTTAASTTITCAAPVSFSGGTATAYTASINIGQLVTGAGAGTGACVTAVASSISLTVSQTGTVSAGTTLTFASPWAITSVANSTAAVALSASINVERQAPVTYMGQSTTLSCTTAATTTLTTAGAFDATGVVVGSYVFGTNIATGTVVTAIASATSLTLSLAGLGVATNTITFIKPDWFRRIPWSVKAPIVQTGTQDMLETFSAWTFLLDIGYNDSTTEPIVLREGFGMSIDNMTLTSVAPAVAGNVDIFIEFTQE